MKTYTTPVLTDITLGEVEIDGEKHTVVGVVPFLAALATVASAAASLASSVSSAKQAYNDGYMDSQIINSLDEVD